MESLFHTLDCRNNPSSGFWQEVHSSKTENLVTSTIFGGDLYIFRDTKGLKKKKCVLTNTSLYYLSKWGIPKSKSDIRWKIIQPFVEGSEKKPLYGFRIYGNKAEDFYVNSSKDLDKWVEKLNKVGIFSTFDEDFMIIKEISKGTGCIVNLCRSLEDMKEYAVKTIDKCILFSKPYMFQSIAAEISALRTTDHPHVIKLFSVYEDERKVCLVLEYLPNGDLSKKLKQVKKFSQEDTLKFIGRLLHTVSYLHALKIVHRDLKLENICFFNDCIYDFKIIDFGLACIYEHGLSQKCGTIGYVAPEVLKGEIYDHKVDIFAIGVIMFYLLSSRPLFRGKNPQEIAEKNKNCQVHISHFNFKGVSKKCVDLINWLISTNPTSRPNAYEALKNELLDSEKPYCIDLYNLDDTIDVHSFEKRNTCETVNYPQFMRTKVMNNNFLC